MQVVYPTVLSGVSLVPFVPTNHRSIVLDGVRMLASVAADAPLASSEGGSDGEARSKMYKVLRSVAIMRHWSFSFIARHLPSM